MRLAEALSANHFDFDATHLTFSKRDVPARLVTRSAIARAPRELVEIDGIRTVALPDLIEMKLRSGLAKVTRAQDLADVIALIRVRGLTAEFASRLSRELRADFRRLVEAVRAEAGER